MRPSVNPRGSQRVLFFDRIKSRRPIAPPLCATLWRSLPARVAVHEHCSQPVWDRLAL